MTKFVQNIVSVRFLEVLDELIDKQIVKNMADFCKRVDYQLQSMSAIKQGKRDVTVELVSKLFTEFNGNPVYLLSGKGNKILDDVALSVVEEGVIPYKRSSNTDKTVETLEKLIESKDEIIKLLKEDNARYKAQGKNRKVQE